MKRFSIIICLLCAIVSNIGAQHISRSYHDRSMSDVLIDLDKSSDRYKISFIYNELEDFTVTQNIEAQDVPSAIRKAIGFYPMKMTIGDSLITVECIRKSERKLIGRLLDNHNLPVEFANIQLLNPQDSTFLCGGVSNANGDFVIPCNQQQAIMKVSYVGYKTISRLVNISRIGTVRMQADAYQLHKVVVKGNLRTDHGDHAIYTFNEEQIKNARHSQDLLENLPGIYTDPMTGKTQSMQGKSIKILINNVPMTTENDLKVIAPSKIKKVEYYEDPPAKYGDVGIVMNIITKPLDTGYAVGYDVKSAFTTGYLNGNAYYKYNKGFHQYSFDYSINMRNYKDWMEESQYTFLKEDGDATYNYQKSKRDGNTDYGFNLKYAYSKPKDITFQATFSPAFSHQFNRGNNQVNTQNNPDGQDGVGYEKEYVDYVQPALDLYLNKEFSHKQTLDVDVLGTYYHTKQQNLNQQWTENKESMVLDDNMRSKMNILSFIGEVDYSKEWEKGELDVGVHTWGKWSDYTVRNMMSDYEPFKYSADLQIHTAYAQYQHTWGKVTCRIGVKNTWRHQSYRDIHSTTNYILPLFSLYYRMKNGSWQLLTPSGINYPGISTLSENSNVIIPGYLKQGNPHVKANAEIGPILRYIHSNSWWYMQIALFGIYTDSQISPYYDWRTIDGKRYAVSSYENANYYWRYGAGSAFQLKPWGNEMLTLVVYAGVERQILSSNQLGKICHWQNTLSYAMRFRKGNYGASFQGSIASKGLLFDKFITNPATSQLSVYYQKGAWRFSLDGMYLFTPAKYKNEDLDNSVVREVSQHVVKDNRRMILLGVSWNLFSGKKKNIQKNINNRDADSGAFK